MSGRLNFGGIASALARTVVAALRKPADRAGQRAGTLTQERPRPKPRPTPTSGGGGHAGDIAVSYEPRNDGDPDPGEVVWAWIPYEEDHSQGKDRPSIAIGFAGSQLVLVPFTSKDQHGRPDTYEIGTGPWDKSGRPSWVKLDRMIPVDPGSVRREGATLDQARFKDLIRRLHELHGPHLRTTQ